jgi:hypothetical protein
MQSMEEGEHKHLHCLSQILARKYLHTHIHTSIFIHTHTHIYIYIYIQTFCNTGHSSISAACPIHGSLRSECRAQGGG